MVKVSMVKVKSFIQEEFGTAAVTKFRSGDTVIDIFDVPSEKFEWLSKQLGLKIELGKKRSQDSRTRWITVPVQEVTIFEE